MPYAQYPMMNWDQLIEDHARALEKLPPRSDGLPTYAQATHSQSSGRTSNLTKAAEEQVSEKEEQQRLDSERKQASTSSQKQPSKLSTLKAIFTGTVHKKNPRYVLEESLVGKASSSRRSSTSSEEDEK